jgi:hypothetical protein
MVAIMDNYQLAKPPLAAPWQALSTTVSIQLVDLKATKPGTEVDRESGS